MFLERTKKIFCWVPQSWQKSIVCHESKYMHSLEMNMCPLLSRGLKKMLENYWEIFKNFNLLINLSRNLHGDLFDQLEEFVCIFSVAKGRSINNACWNRFDQKLQREHKLTDLDFLPTYMQVRLHYAKQTKVMAYIWRNLIQLLIAMSKIKDDGVAS